MIRSIWKIICSANQQNDVLKGTCTQTFFQFVHLKSEKLGNVHFLYLNENKKSIFIYIYPKSVSLLHVSFTSEKHGFLIHLSWIQQRFKRYKRIVHLGLFQEIKWNSKFKFKIPMRSQFKRCCKTDKANFQLFSVRDFK